MLDPPFGLRPTSIGGRTADPGAASRRHLRSTRRRAFHTVHPATPVERGAGEVVVVGPDVRLVRPGDRVTAALLPL
ncbi:hypothetical protein ACU686_12195 [Yinghuangia aomiensis]